MRHLPLWALVLLWLSWGLSLAATDTLTTLNSLLQLHQSLQADIQTLSQRLSASQSSSEKEQLKLQLNDLEQDLRGVQGNFEDLAAGARIASLKGEEGGKFDFQQELLMLIRPALEEMKEMTGPLRKKTELKERINHFSQRMPVIEQALANLQALLQQTEPGELRLALEEQELGWRKQQALAQGELQAAQLQLQSLIDQEVSLTEASQNYLKTFFQKRGLYLFEALLVVIVIFLLSRLNHYLLRRFVPGFTRPQRSFRVRLLELIHYVGTLILMVLGPVLVFYLVEDWLLLSLGILLLLG
ncbi:MAG: hypothetical protein HQL47_09780, partial [Gammaproteobacteria bacterium]|nr:hypothetical protein [Gammaproteobacteria bacterium]